MRRVFQKFSNLLLDGPASSYNAISFSLFIWGFAPDFSPAGTFSIVYMDSSHVFLFRTKSD